MPAGHDESLSWVMHFGCGVKIFLNILCQALQLIVSLLILRTVWIESYQNYFICSGRQIKQHGFGLSACLLSFQSPEWNKKNTEKKKSEKSLCTMHKIILSDKYYSCSSVIKVILEQFSKEWNCISLWVLRSFSVQSNLYRRGLVKVLIWQIVQLMKLYWLLEFVACFKMTDLTLLNSSILVESKGLPINPIYSNTVVSSPPWLFWKNNCRTEH